MTNDVRNTPPVTYTCRCDAVAVGTEKHLPMGWQRRTFEEFGGAAYDAFLCFDCADSVNRQLADIRNTK